MTMTYKFDLVRVEMNHRTKYMSEVRPTPLPYLEQKLIGKRWLATTTTNLNSALVSGLGHLFI